MGLQLALVVVDQVQQWSKKGLFERCHALKSESALWALYRAVGRELEPHTLPKRCPNLVKVW